ncbi:unnamed protein product [Lactuca virosa]|uniref:SNF2 N-terminal domain-containing protein n=1 Tax=Lactuca virosa TaxID=75947 RepID=A0AAU9P7B8_9ASTR|nr:unnamed protein product [Lactuca virosa]
MIHSSRPIDQTHVQNTLTQTGTWLFSHLCDDVQLGVAVASHGVYCFGSLLCNFLFLSRRFGDNIYAFTIMDKLLVGDHQELWALFNFRCPELLGDKKCFKEKYESAIQRGNDKNASDRDKRIGSAVAQDLRNYIQLYFLRRLKSEVFRDNDATNTVKLSKKNEIIVWLRLSKCQEAIDRLRIVLRVIVAGKGITSSGFLRFLRKEKKPADRLMIACSCFQLSPTALSCKSYN